MLTDRMSGCGALSATATFYLATCIVHSTYTHRCSRLNCCTVTVQCSVPHTCDAEVSRACNLWQPRCWGHLDSNYDQWTLTTTNIVDDTAYSSASPPSWMWTTVADWHKLSKASEPETSVGQKMQFLPTSAAFGAPVGSDAISISQSSMAS